MTASILCLSQDEIIGRVFTKKVGTRAGSYYIQYQIIRRVHAAGKMPAGYLLRRLDNNSKTNPAGTEMFRTDMGLLHMENQYGPPEELKREADQPPCGPSRNGHFCNPMTSTRCAVVCRGNYDAVRRSA